MKSPINNIFPEVHGLQTFVATIPSGFELKDILEPGYWANVYKKLVAHKTHIMANWEDGTRLVELRVIGVGLNYAKVRVMQDYDFAAPAAVAAPPAEVKVSESPAAAVTGLRDRDFEVSWKGPAHKHSVIRITDKSYVKDGFDTKAEADEWLVKYIKGEVTVEAKAA
jgi:hypothetical protein